VPNEKLSTVHRQQHTTQKPTKTSYPIAPYAFQTIAIFIPFILAIAGYQGLLISLQTLSSLHLEIHASKVHFSELPARALTKESRGGKGLG
jgi:hypothetical protein